MRIKRDGSPVSSRKSQARSTGLLRCSRPEKRVSPRRCRGTPGRSRTSRRRWAWFVAWCRRVRADDARENTRTTEHHELAEGYSAVILTGAGSDPARWSMWRWRTSSARRRRRGPNAGGVAGLAVDEVHVAAAGSVDGLAVDGLVAQVFPVSRSRPALGCLRWRPSTVVAACRCIPSADTATRGAVPSAR